MTMNDHFSYLSPCLNTMPDKKSDLGNTDLCSLQFKHTVCHGGKDMLARAIDASRIIPTVRKQQEMNASV